MYSKSITRPNLDHINPKGPLKFFLIDACEDEMNSDSVFLFGKAEIDNHTRVDCCARIVGLQREIFIVPRRGVSVHEVEKEIKEIIGNIKSFSKVEVNFNRVIKKYCFEIDIDYRNEEVEVLQLTYSYKY